MRSVQQLATTGNPIGGLPDVSTTGTYRSTGFPKIGGGQNGRTSQILFGQKLHTDRAQVVLAPIISCSKEIVVLLPKENVRLFYAFYSTLNNIYALIVQRARSIPQNARWRACQSAYFPRRDLPMR